MSWLRMLIARIRGLFSRGRADRELDDEIRFHLEMQIEDNLRAGMAPDDARYAALRSFGAIESMKEGYRDRSAFRLIETIAQDWRYAIRSLSKSPGFTITAVLTLALAIGADTAMFGVLHAVLLQPLPYRSPQQLAMLWTENPAQNLYEGRSAYWNFERWRNLNTSFSDMAVFDPVSVTLTSGGGAERITAARISASFFPLLGIQPSQGRFFSAEEAQQRQRLAVISDRFWRTHFGRSAIGAAIEIDGLRSHIIGVLPANFQFAGFDVDVWEPQTLFPDWETRRSVRGSDSWFVLARLRPGVTFEQAQVEMSSLSRRIDAQLPPVERNRGVKVEPLSLHVTGPRIRLALWILTGAVFFVLLVAATNIASLSLARTAERGREFAIRVALGASRARVIRQLLAESSILAIASGLVGLGVAWAGIRLIPAIAPPDLPRRSEVGLHAEVFVWALTLCIITGILVGLAPALIVARRDATASAPLAGRASSGAGIRGMRRALVVIEFALAIILLSGAGLLIRSLWSVESVDPGFRPDHVLSMEIRLPAAMPGAQRRDIYRRALDRIVSLPGVDKAGFISDVFINLNPEQIITTEDGDRTVSGRLQFRRDEVSAGLFETIGAPLLRGRFFSDADGPDSPRVVIINDALARRLWPARDAVGRRLKLGPRDSTSPWLTVVGVVADMRRQGLENAPVPQMFEPITQNPSGGGSLLIRTSTDRPLALAPLIQSAVRGVDRNALLYSPTTLEDRVGAFLAPRRFQTWLVGAFSLVALLLAAIGINGLIQYSVAMRTQEIGIRMAVGAQASDIFRMVIGEGLRLSLAGLALGLIGALIVARASRSLLFGVTAADPLTFAAVSLLLVAVTVGASYLPARRAMKANPVAALHHV